MIYLLDAALQLCLVSLIGLHLVAAPYTKVEESFNIQATHDILSYGIPWLNSSNAISAQYDHIEFPGSVPRTFLGALVLAAFSNPFTAWIDQPQNVQILVRSVLGLLNAISLLYFQSGVRGAFGRTAANWYIILQVSQFHVIYYASRTLPNMFAFILTNIAFRNYILSLASHSASSDAKVHQRLSLYFLTIAGVVFRSEIAVLVAAETLFLLLARQASLLETIIPAGTAGLIMGLLISVPIDSFFWQEYPMWSELSGFYYNTVLGKSSDWGVSPWHFYFSSALPRLLLNPFTYALMFAAVASPATRARALAVLAPCLGFVAAYSLLPHKEWRFIVYAVPPLTAVAGVGASWVWARRAKTALYRVLSLALVGSALASLAASAALLAVSRLNYPGGAAVVRLREIAAAEPASVRVFADNLVCQTGLTRFLEARGQTVPGTRAPKWVFDKTENQTALLDPLFWHNFDYVLAEHPERIIGAWEVVDVVNGFAGIEIVGPGSEDVVESADNGHELLKRVETLSKKYVTKGWWVRVRMDQKVNILKRQDEAEVLKGAKSVETL